MTKNDVRQGFWREMKQGFCVLQRIQWQAPWKAQKSC